MKGDSESLVIFDCDGTLVDSETISMQVMIDFVADLGVSITHDEALRLFAGKDLKLVIEDVRRMADKDPPEDFIPQFRERQFKALRESLDPMDGADELLSQMDRPFCVASNAPLNKVNICLKTTKLDRHFDSHRIFSAYQVNAWKPNPKLFHAVAESMGARDRDCVVVEDSLFGIDAGIAAGMKVIAFDPGGSIEPQLSGPRSGVQTVRHLLEVQDLIRNF